MQPHWEWEAKLGFPARSVGGVDEVGRGCIAGPVVAAVCIIRQDRPEPEWSKNVRDSKQLTENQREVLDAEIRSWAESGAGALGIGSCSPEEIDRWNILRASHVAMVRALGGAECPVDGLLVDGNLLPLEWKPERRPSWRAVPVVKGDQQSVLIAAASIVAKVYRDRWMQRLDEEVPGYGFAVHKGYPTPRHLEALGIRGVSEMHRKSFGPVQRQLDRSAKSGCSEGQDGMTSSVSLQESPKTL